AIARRERASHDRRRPRRAGTPARRRARDARVLLGNPVASLGTHGSAQGREPAAHGRVQDPRRVNTIAQLSAEERSRGVLTASAGNHGQAVAWAAREAGIAATIFVPEAAPMAKIEAARGYGATVELAGDGFDETVAVARTREAETGATFVHAFEDARVVA